MRKIIIFVTVLLLTVSLSAAAGGDTQQLDDRKQINILNDEKQDDTVRGNVASESVKGSIEGVGKKKVKKDKVTTFIVDYDGDNTPIIKGSALGLKIAELAKDNNNEDVNAIDPETVDDINAGTTPEWSTGKGDASDYKLTIFMPDGTPVRAKTVTIPGKSVEQDEYREGNDAKHEKKLWGQVTFDDLEMERGVKPGETELHDWFEDVRAGKADSARKEISVKLLNEEGKTVGAGQVIVILDLAGNGEGNDDEVSLAAKKGGKVKDVFSPKRASKDGKKGHRAGAGETIEVPVYELAHSDENQIGDEVSSISKRSARKGRNPQTGKEIKIPARDGDHDGSPKGLTTALAMEGKVKFFNEEKGYASIKDSESGEEYFVHATLIDEIRKDDDVTFDLREGRKGMNAVDVRRTD